MDISLFAELKRRNVFRVAVAYLVMAWLLVQVVSTLGNLFDLPNVVGQSVVILLAIGFPVALVISWIYEVTPQGLATQAAVDAGLQTTSGRKLNAVIICGLVLALTFVVLDAYVLEGPESGLDTDGRNAVSAELEKTLAVLPFANLSSDPEQEYFSDGLTEELLNSLAQVDELKVAARTSAFSCKGRNVDMRTIGEELGVNYILEGSVRKSTDALRITAQLIQADNGFHLWSDTYDRELADIFDIQEDIASKVTLALSISLGAGDASQPGNTRNVEAYDTFFKGLDAFYQYTPDSLLTALGYFEEAVKLDPEYFWPWYFMAVTVDTNITFIADDTGRDILAWILRMT